MASGEKLYEGKAKIVYSTDDPDVYIQDFKDSATAFDGKKKGTIGDKGHVNNRISARLFQMLEEGGVKTHFLGLESDTAMRIRRLDMFQVEFVVRNIAAGSLSKRIGYPEGTALKNPPIVEYYYKDDELGDPLLCMAHLEELEVVTPVDLDEATAAAKRINTLLVDFFARPQPAAGRLQAGVRPRRRRGAPAGRRDLTGHLSSVGRRDQGEARQGPVPARSGRGRRRVSRGAPPHLPGRLSAYSRRCEMFKVSVHVTPKAGIMDPQGAAIERALPALGFEGVDAVRVGRFITLKVDGADVEIVRKDVDDMCRQLLANPIIEDYSFELEATGPFAEAMAAEEDILLPADANVRMAGEHASSPWTAADPYASREGDVE